MALECLRRVARSTLGVWAVVAAGTGSALVDSLVVDDVSWTASGNFIDVTLNYSYRPMFASTLSLFGFGDDIKLSANIGPSIQNIFVIVVN